MTQSERERLAKLETKVDALIRQQERQEKVLNEVHNAVVAARGAKWAVMTLVGAAGVVGGLVGQFFPR